MGYLILRRALIIALVIELITVLFRFGFDLQSTRDTGVIMAPITFGLRIHHGYIGVVLVAVAIIFFRVKPRVYLWLVSLGLGLFISDMVHHFLVLYLTTGNPQFDTVYPSYSVIHCESKAVA